MEEPTHLVTADIYRNKFEFDDAYQLRIQAIEETKGSEDAFNSLTPKHQQALISILERALQVLGQSASRWVSHTITGTPGDMITLKLSVLLSAIDEEVDLIDSGEDDREPLNVEVTEESVGGC